MVYYNPYIIGLLFIPKKYPKQPGALFFIAHLEGLHIVQGLARSTLHLLRAKFGDQYSSQTWDFFGQKKCRG